MIETLFRLFAGLGVIILVGLVTVEIGEKIITLFIKEDNES